MTLSGALAEHRLLVCVGTGGVGKTTLAAALALAGAMSGRRAVVLTIDPARALGRALGHLDLGGDVVPISPERFSSQGLRPEGTLAAGMLDPSRTWDAFIRHNAPTPAVARALLGNPFYRQLSRRYAGATEYAAMEELGRLDEGGRYDLIVLDTPPAAHALDFVRAPERIERLLDPEVEALLLRPHPYAARLLSRLGRATGEDTLRQVSDFVTAFARLFEALRRRSASSRALLRSPRTAFVLVTGPDAEGLSGAEALIGQLATLDVSLRAVVQNRVHPLDGASEPDAPRHVEALLDALAVAGASAPSLDWLRDAYHAAVWTAEAEVRAWRALVDPLPAEVARARLPELEREVRSLADLAELGAALVAR